MNMIAFIHIKKTAGKAVKYQMRRAFGLGHCDVKRWRRDADYFSAADLQRLLKVYPRLRSIAGHSVKPYSDLKAGFPKIRYYTFLRDPIQRSISHYQYRMSLGSVNCSFETWIKDESNHNWQVQTLAGASNLDWALHLIEHDISFIGLQERLDESLTLMSRAFNLNHRARVDSERINAAKNNRIRDEIIRSTRNLRFLQRANQLDIELYRYVEAVVYPRQQRIFGDALEKLGKTRGKNFWNRYSQGYCANVIYRELVYKPIVWLSHHRIGRLA